MMLLKALSVAFLVSFTVASGAIDGECFGQISDEPETFLSGPVSDETKALLNEGERAFSVHLIKSLFEDFNATSKDQRNIFISPASVYQTLMLAYFGAQEPTSGELERVLGFEDKVKRPEVIKNYLFKRAFQAIRERDPESAGYELTHANKFYFDRTLPLSQCLQLVLQDEMEALDFSNADKARKVINNWVKEKTKKKISSLLPEGALDGSHVAMVNAAYFKGQWQSQFKPEDTKRNNFYLRRDQIHVTEFMKQEGKFNYYTSEELRAHVLEMPYKGDDVSMVLILPPFEDDSLHETVRRLTPDTLRGVMSEVRSGFFSVDDLKVTVPKFKVEQTFELAHTLQKLGLETLFDATHGNLRGFLTPEAREAGNDDLSLQSAIHKSFIEVNEEGSEAAASTALFGFRSARPLFHTEFTADHPFLFLIYDKPSDTILFFGVYQNPAL